LCGCALFELSHVNSKAAKLPELTKENSQGTAEP
jgi:hypothetical protein